MKRVVRLTESDLQRIVKRVIKENNSTSEYLLDFMDNIMSIADECDDRDQFESMIHDFYSDYEEELDELTDEEYDKLDHFIDSTYRNLPSYADNINKDMHDTFGPDRDDEFDDEY